MKIKAPFRTATHKATDCIALMALKLTGKFYLVDWLNW